MKAYALLLAGVLAAAAISVAVAQQPPAAPAQPAASPPAPAATCLPDDRVQALAKLKSPEITEQADHAELFATTKILPAGSTVTLLLERPYDHRVKYHAVTSLPPLGHLGSVIARRAPDDNPLIKDRLVSPESTLITFDMPPDLSNAWGTATVHV